MPNNTTPLFDEYMDGGSAYAVRQFNQRIAEWREINPDGRFDMKGFKGLLSDLDYTFDGIDLRNTDLHGAVFSDFILKNAQFEGADLRGAVGLGQNNNVATATFDANTQFPDGFDPKAAGMIDMTPKKAMDSAALNNPSQITLGAANEVGGVVLHPDPSMGCTQVSGYYMPTQSPNI